MCTILLCNAIEKRCSLKYLPGYFLNWQGVERLEVQFSESFYAIHKVFISVSYFKPNEIFKHHIIDQKFITSDPNDATLFHNIPNGQAVSI